MGDKNDTRGKSPKKNTKISKRNVKVSAAEQHLLSWDKLVVTTTDHQ